MKIPQYKPLIDRQSLAKKVNDYILSDGYFTEFSHTSEFQDILSSYLNVQYCYVVNNGTISLSLALLALGIKPGDHVLVPNITMIASSNAVRLIGATPVLVDVEPKTLCMDLNKAEEYLSSAKAVIYVTLNGRSHLSSELKTFRDRCNQFGVSIIEDNAQSLGSRHDDNTPIACIFGQIGSFSFSMPKIITTGQGGCLVTNDDEIAHKIGRLKDFGRANGGTDVHDEFGINSKFTEIQAIMGLDQMQDIDSRVERKQAIYQTYLNILSDIPEVDFIVSRFGVAPWFVDIYTDRRDELQTFLKQMDIGTRSVYPPLTNQVVNQGILHSDIEVSENFSSRGLWLPCSLDITDAEIALVCSHIRKFFNA